MKATTEQPPNIGADEIAIVAWQIWVNEGRPEGRDQEHWFRAERELHAGKQQAASRQQAPPVNHKTSPSPARTKRPAKH